MAESAAKNPEEKQQATAEADKNALRDPILLALIVILLTGYVVGQWMTFTAISAKLEALEQRIVDSTSRVDTKVSSVQSQLAELLGEGQLRELLAPAAIQTVAQAVGRLDHKLDHAEALHDLLRVVGDLGLGEIAERADGRGQARSWLQDLIAEGRVVPLRFRTRQRYVAVENVSRYRDALGAERSGRTAAGRPAGRLGPRSHVLPARVPELAGVDVDLLSATGAVLWRALEPLGPHDGRIAPYRPDRYALLAPPTGHAQGSMEAVLRLKRAGHDTGRARRDAPARSAAQPHSESDVLEDPHEPTAAFRDSRRRQDHARCSD